MANIESHFKKIPYDQLNGKQKEIFNFQKIALPLQTTASTASNLQTTGKLPTSSPIT
jgi:hypothetical protein